MSENENNEQNWKSQWGPELFILALAVLLRVWDFGAAEFMRYADRDAYRGWLMIHGKFRSMMGPELTYGGNLPGPFLYLALGFVLLLFGGNPESLVGLAALCSLGALVLSYFAVRELFGRRVALIAALHLCILPSHFFNARLAWNPTWGLPLAAGAFLLLARSIRRGPSLRRIGGAGTLIGLAVQCHGSYFALLMPALLVPAFFVRPLRERAKFVGILLAFTLLPQVPYFFELAGRPVEKTIEKIDRSAYYFELRSQFGETPMEPVARGEILSEEELLARVGERPLIPWTPLSIAGHQIFPSANEDAYDFRWLTRVDNFLNYGAWGPLWRFLQGATALLLLGLFGLGVFEALKRWHAKRDEAAPLLATWLLAPLVPITLIQQVYFDFPDDPSMSAWVSGSRYLLPAFPAASAFAALGVRNLWERFGHKRWILAPLALAVLCGVLIDFGLRFTTYYFNRSGAINRMTISQKLELADALHCTLGLSLEDIGNRVVDRSLLAIEDDFMLPFAHAAAHCPRDATHVTLPADSCLSLDLPARLWGDNRYWPGRVANQNIKEAARLTPSGLTPILQTDSFVISTYKRMPCLKGNVINGYFSDERDPERTDASWRRRN